MYIYTYKYTNSLVATTLFLSASTTIINQRQSTIFVFTHHTYYTYVLLYNDHYNDIRTFVFNLI